MHLGGQIEQHRHGLRGVEVIVHGCAEVDRRTSSPVNFSALGGSDRIQRTIQPAKCAASIVQVGVAEIEGAAVVGTQHQAAYGLAVVSLEHLSDGEEVAKRLGHLLVVDVEEAVVQPVAHKRPASGPFTLGDLVLVMRKLQVQSPAVDVEVLAQEGAAHGRALDMPPGAARTEGTVPPSVIRLISLCSLPQHEVQRVFLAISHRHTLASAQFVQGLARQATVARKPPHREVDISVRADVGQTSLTQGADHRQHLRHEVRRPGFVRRRFDTQGTDVLTHRGDHFIGELPYGDAALDRAPDDLVLDVGDVAHVGHPPAARTQPAIHHVERHHHARVAHVAEVVDRHAADIHPHMTGLDGAERLEAPRQGIVDVKAHARTVPTTPGRNS